MNVKVIIYHCLVNKQVFRFTKLAENGVKDIQVPYSVKKTQWLPLCSNMRLEDGIEASPWARLVWDLTMNTSMLSLRKVFINETSISICPY